MEARHLWHSPAEVLAREFPTDPTRPLRNVTLVTTTILAAVVRACSGRVAAARGQDQISRAAQERGNNSADPAMHVTGCVERGLFREASCSRRCASWAQTARHKRTSNGRPTTGGRSDAHAVLADRYTLRSLERGADLGEFVGKRMAITRRLTVDRDQTGLGTRGGTAEGQTGANDTRTPSDRPGGTSAAGDTAAAANIRQLDAETIRTVAGTCTPATDRR